MTDTATRHQSSNGFGRMPDLIDRLVQESIAPPVAEPSKMASNLLETWEAYWLQVSLPGVDLATLQIEVVARRITVKGTYRVPSIEAATYLRSGVAVGEFSETFMVPGEVDSDTSEAQYDRGILTIRMPKVSHLKPKAIQVHVAA